MTKKIINVQTGKITTEEYTAEELAEIQANRDNLSNEQMAEIRVKRNRLLAETDYLALADSTLTDEMRTYRQALRDLPANTTDPANPVWPTKPE